MGIRAQAFAVAAAIVFGGTGCASVTTLRADRVTHAVCEPGTKDTGSLRVSTEYQSQGFPAVEVYAWHWVTIPAGTTYATSAKNPTGDVIEAIGRLERVLADRTAPRLERQQALKWLVHLVGDIHQPLHVGSRGDRGGNEQLVLWFGAPSNLHSVWDGGFIEKSELAFSELAEKVDVASVDDVRAWQAASVLDWAEESRALGEGAYAIGDGRLSWRYLATHWPTVERRLAQAGVRLAGVLDRALRTSPDRGAR